MVFINSLDLDIILTPDGNEGHQIDMAPMAAWPLDTNTVFHMLVWTPFIGIAFSDIRIHRHQDTLATVGLWTQTYASAAARSQISPWHQVTLGPLDTSMDSNA
ncbi:hypothetical protein STEG23_035319 [Scotinomys teguina]